MNDEIKRKRAIHLWIAWVISFFIGGVVYQFFSMADIVDVEILDVSLILLKPYNIIWFLAIALIYFPLLLAVHKKLEQSQVTKLLTVVKVILVMLSLGLLVTFVATVVSLFRSITI